MKNVLITGLDKEFDKKLASVFTREGYNIFAMGNEQIAGVKQLPVDLKEAAGAIKKDSGCLDIFIDTTDVRSRSDYFNVRSGLNYQVIKELYDANVTRPMEMLEVFYPLLDEGEGKRLCYLTSAEASINETRGTEGYGYKMAKAGLHNFLQITWNVLVPKNYTLRVFDPVYDDNQLAAEAAFNYFTRGRGVERGDPKRDDENNLVFRDAYGRQHAW